MCRIVIQYQLCRCADYSPCTLLETERSVQHYGTAYHVVSEIRLRREEGPCKREIVRRTGSPDKGYLVPFANIDCPESIVEVERAFLRDICAACCTDCSGEIEEKTDDELLMEWLLTFHRE